MGFKKVDVKSLEMKPFEKIGSELMLISAAKDGNANLQKIKDFIK